MLEKFKVQNHTGLCKCGGKVYLPILFPVTSLNVHYLKQGTVWPAKSLLMNHQQIYRNMQGACLIAVLGVKLWKGSS